MSSRSEVQSIDSMKKKNCWKISNRSSIPLTIHATESIIQLQSRSFASPRSQETRIEFASRGRDPDLSSLIDGTRETGGGIGRDEEVLSFFFLAWNNRHGFVSACFEKVDRPILCAVCTGILADYTRKTLITMQIYSCLRSPDFKLVTDPPLLFSPSSSYFFISYIVQFFFVEAELYRLVSGICIKNV